MAIKEEINESTSNVILTAVSECKKTYAFASDKDNTVNQSKLEVRAIVSCDCPWFRLYFWLEKNMGRFFLRQSCGVLNYFESCSKLFNEVKLFTHVEQVYLYVPIFIYFRQQELLNRCHIESMECLLANWMFCWVSDKWLTPTQPTIRHFSHLTICTIIDQPVTPIKWPVLFCTIVSWYLNLPRSRLSSYRSCYSMPETWR